MGTAAQLVDVVVGYLVTHPDGYEARLGPDLARAEMYAARQHGTLEPMLVRRAAPPEPSHTPAAR